MGKLDNYFCEGQMSIFDFIGQEKRFPGIIGDLDEELCNRFDCEPVAKYEVWSHVPHLGKRYSFSIDVIGQFDITDIIEKYKTHDIELSVLGHESIFNNNAYSIFVSTMWTTKGHKEML